MATSTTIPTKLKLRQVTSASKVDFDSDTLKMVLVIAGSGAPDTSKTGIEFLQDVFSGGNTEVIGTGYARATLSGVTVAFDATSTIAVDLTFTTVTFSQNAAGPNNIRYGIIVDTTIGAGDSTNPVVAVCDLGAVQSTQTGDLLLTPPTGGVIQWA